MNVVDLSGWVEYFTNGKNAEFFITPIQDVENLLVPTLCIYEVFKRLLMDTGRRECLTGGRDHVVWARSGAGS